MMRAGPSKVSKNKEDHTMQATTELRITFTKESAMDLYTTLMKRFDDLCEDDTTAEFICLLEDYLYPNDFT